MIMELKENLLDTKRGIIAHQVNCKGEMGAGVAKQIRQKLLSKKQFEHYRRMCKENSPETLLGSCWCYSVNGSKTLEVANLFAENITTGKGLGTDYGALEESLSILKQQARVYHMAISIPGYLGCDLAGGDWEYVYAKILTPLFEDYPYGLRICYLPKTVKTLWEEFGDVSMDPDTECIESTWHGFPAGTHREEIWKWFEETFHVSVAEDLMGLDSNPDAELYPEYPCRERKCKNTCGDRMRRDPCDRRTEDPSYAGLDHQENLLRKVVAYMGSQFDGVKKLLEIGFSVDDMRRYGVPEYQIPTNTLIEYLYRAGSNNKKYSKAVVSGLLDESQVKEIWDCLEEGTYFFPGQVGLPDDNRYSGTVDDHAWFELQDITFTNNKPTVELSAQDLIRNFRKAKDAWDLGEYETPFTCFFNPLIKMRRLSGEEIIEHGFRYIRELVNTDFEIWNAKKRYFLYFRDARKGKLELYREGTLEEISEFFIWMQDHSMDEDIISEIDALPENESEKDVWNRRFDQRRN